MEPPMGKYGVRRNVFFISVAYITKEANPSLAKQPLKFIGGLAKLRFHSLVK